MMSKKTFDRYFKKEIQDLKNSALCILSFQEKLLFDQLVNYRDAEVISLDEFKEYEAELDAVCNEKRLENASQQTGATVEAVLCAVYEKEAVEYEKAEAEFERVKKNDVKLFDNDEENLTFYFGYFTALSDFGIITADRCDEMTDELTTLFQSIEGNSPAKQELHIE